MNNRSTEAEAEARLRKCIPFILAALMVLLAAFSSSGILSSILVIMAFLLCFLPHEKILFFIDGIEESRRSGRDVLHRLSDAQIIQINDTVRAGLKIQAIKELRAINHDGLKEAKNAVDLLNDFGLKWRESSNQPLCDLR